MPARRKRGISVNAISTIVTAPINCQWLTARPTAPAPCPAMPTNCSVEMFDATIEMPISHHGSVRPARK